MSLAGPGKGASQSKHSGALGPRRHLCAHEPVTPRRMYKHVAELPLVCSDRQCGNGRAANEQKVAVTYSLAEDPSLCSGRDRGQASRGRRVRPATTRSHAHDAGHRMGDEAVRVLDGTSRLRPVLVCDVFRFCFARLSHRTFRMAESARLSSHMTT